MSQLNSMGTIGADWSWLVPASEGASNVIQGIFSSKKAGSAPPPAPSIPWVPIAAIGGGALLLMVVMSKKRGTAI